EICMLLPPGSQSASKMIPPENDCFSHQQWLHCYQEPVQHQNGNQPMKIARILLFMLFTVAATSLSPAAAGENEILKIVIDGDINPVSAMYIVKTIEKAEKEGSTCVIIQ